MADEGICVDFTLIPLYTNFPRYLCSAYANLLMADFETKLLEGSVDKPLVWFRYIDDVVFIWTHSQSKLDSFLEYVNNFHQAIKFTSASSREEVSFLDVRVIRKGCTLETDLYCKPTDTHQYLHKESCQPWHTKKAVPYGQALRIRRICSEDGNFQERSEELVGWLTNRGYEEGFVRNRLIGSRKWIGTCYLIRMGDLIGVGGGNVSLLL